MWTLISVFTITSWIFKLLQLAWRHELTLTPQNSLTCTREDVTLGRGGILFLPPFNTPLLWFYLLWSESNVMALKPFSLTGQDCRGCPQASTSQGWVIDPDSPSTLSPGAMPRLRPLRSITKPPQAKLVSLLSAMPIHFSISTSFFSVKLKLTTKKSEIINNQTISIVSPLIVFNTIL